MFDRFTDEARRAMAHARQAAVRLEHASIGSEHLLLGLLDVDGAHRALLARRGGSVAALRAEVERRAADANGRGMVSPAGAIPFTPDARRTLERAAGAGAGPIRPWELLVALGAERVGLGGRLVHELGLTAGMPAAPPEPGADDDAAAQLFDLSLQLRDLHRAHVAHGERLAQVQRLLRLAFGGVALAAALGAALAALLVR